MTLNQPRDLNSSKQTAQEQASRAALRRDRRGKFGWGRTQSVPSATGSPASATGSSTARAFNNGSANSSGSASNGSANGVSGVIAPEKSPRKKTDPKPGPGERRQAVQTAPPTWLVATLMSWQIWLLFAMGGVTATGGLAVMSLLRLPQAWECPRVFWPLASASLRV